MDVIESYYSKILYEYESQVNLYSEKYRLLNEQLNNLFSPIQLISITILVGMFVLMIYRFLFTHDDDISTRIREAIFRLIRRLPFVQRKIVAARLATLTSVHDDMAKSIPGHEFIKALPETGFSKDELLGELDKYRNYGKSDYKSGFISGCVYTLVTSDMAEIQHQILNLFGDTNPLHANVFPDIRTMEAEVVRCVATMFHGDIDVCGTMTSGGTESLLMACKTYRDLAFSKGITKPEM